MIPEFELEHPITLEYQLVNESKEKVPRGQARICIEQIIAI